MLILQVCQQPKYIVQFSFVELSVKQACRECTFASANSHSKSCRQQKRVVMHGLGGQHDAPGLIPGVSQAESESDTIQALTSLQADPTLAFMS